MKTHIIFIVFFLYLYNLTLFANIQLIKKENADSNTTLLVIAGIHGNEPGSYFAASLLSTHYQITSNNLWVIPNLNKLSIQANRRGIHGDMNRKFSHMEEGDKDKEIIEEVKKLILHKKVSLILNLHDGHGFYRKKSQSNIFNPNAWGQTCVIDQCELNKEQNFSHLNEIASTVANNLNTKLLQKHHSFNVRNTKTKFEDEAMQLSLTYFAVTNNKPAFAIESSKNLSSLAQKVYYQLSAIEEFMKIMNITFIRDFDLTEKSIQNILRNHGTLRINNNISFNLSNIKKSLSYIPIKSKNNVFEFSNPLGSIKKVSKKYFVYIGNKKILQLKPQYFELGNDCSEYIEVEIDKKRSFIKKATYFSVNDDFKIIQKDNIRVNIIGFTQKGKSDESAILIHKHDLQKRFSVDREKKQYRIEFYKNNKFCSILMVHFK